VIEVITGKSLDKCMAERIFRPLGMKDTAWSVPKSKLNRLATLYGSSKQWKHFFGNKGIEKISNGMEGRKGFGSLVQIDAGGNSSVWREGRQCKILSGGGFVNYLAGGLVSTPADMARWVKMLMNYGVMENGKRFFKKQTVQSMEINRIEKRKCNKIMIEEYGTDRVSFLGDIGAYRDAGGDEYGMGGAACTWWNIDRQDDTATVWFAQHLDMPEFYNLKLKGVNNDKANLWYLLHDAIRPSGVKRKQSPSLSSSSKKAKTTKASSSTSQITKGSGTKA